MDARSKSYKKIFKKIVILRTIEYKHINNITSKNINYKTFPFVKNIIQVFIIQFFDYF